MWLHYRPWGDLTLSHKQPIPDLELENAKALLSELGVTADDADSIVTAASDGRAVSVRRKTFA